MDQEALKLYESLMKSYGKTGKIGRATPYDYDHAKRMAYRAAVDIIARRKIKKPLPETKNNVCTMAYIQLKLLS